MQAWPAWNIVERLRNVGVLSPEARPGGTVIYSGERLLSAVRADRGYHRYVKYVVITDDQRRPELRVPVPRDYNGHPYLSGGRGEILAGGQIHLRDDHFRFTNETTHFRTGPAQTGILDMVLRKMGVDYSLAFPLEGREPDLYVDVRTDGLEDGC